MPSHLTHPCQEQDNRPAGPYPDGESEHSFVPIGVVAARLLKKMERQLKERQQ